MRLILTILLIGVSILSYSQNDYQYSFVKTEEEIKIDGIFHEEIWKQVDTISGFTRNFPVDSGLAKERTRVRLFYSDDGIYIGVVCFGPDPYNAVIQSLKRDFKLENTDAFTVSIDPFGDRTNGFSFSLSPFNVQREGLISGGGGWGATTSWDNKWYSATTLCPDYWTGEMFIPYKTLRYSNNVHTWKINFSRTNYRINEKSSWIPIPINFGLESLVFTGDLNWDQPPPEVGPNVSLIPYVTSGLSGRYDSKTTESVISNIGADAKIAVTPSLNLDVTINPDFSNVEIDDQILNLDRFSIALPEKRQFFIENSDLFNEFGFRRIRPFFSRNIGLKDTSGNGTMIQVPILSGMRLSGKLNKYWRLGVMNVVELDSTAYAFSNEIRGVNQNIDFSNYSVNTYNIGVIQRQLGSNSNIGGIFVNQLPFHEKEGVNSVAGVDFNYTSKDGKYKGKLFSHQSFTEGKQQKAISQQSNASFFLYSTKKYFLMWNHEYVGENYNAVNGFVPRKGIWRLEPFGNYNFYPQSNLFQSHKLGVYWNFYTDLNYNRLDDYRRVNLTTKFLNTSQTDFAIVRNYIGLNNDFDPTFKWDTAYSAGESFKNIFFTASYWSNITNSFSYKVDTDYGQYFSGTKLGVNIELYYRYQPYLLFSLISNNNFVDLPGFEKAILSRFGPKVELTLSNKLFINYYLQYNSTSELFTNNVRLQWRFKPLSDLFIVYTDNYGASSEFDSHNFRFQVQDKINRAIVLKFVYWLNL